MSKASMIACCSSFLGWVPADVMQGAVEVGGGREREGIRGSISPKKSLFKILYS